MRRSVAVRLVGGVVWLLVVLCPAQAQAQTGKLAGRVTDTTGAPLPGVNVTIEGTSLGAATDGEGQYALIQVPPGTYRVRFGFVGFQTKIVRGVVVSSNQTKTLDVTLGEEVVAGDEVTVTAEREIVDLTQTSTMATLSQSEIETLPVQNLQEIVNLQAGVVEGHFRGGRRGEVQYQVDGVSVNDPFNNRSSVRLDRSVLKEVQVISGTFDAEYGQAMSGVVNAVLRNGDEGRYEASAKVYLGDYWSAEDERFPHINDINPLVRQNLQATLSGPVPLIPNTTFLMNGQRLVDQGYLYGRRVFQPTDSADFEGGRFLEFASGDSAWVPLSDSRDWSFLGKITNTSLPNVEIAYQALGNVVKRQGYSHGYRLNPEGLSTQSDFSITHGLDWSHTVADNTFYELSVRHNYVDHTDYMYEDARDPRYFEAGLPQGSAQFAEGALVQGVDLGRFVQRTNGLLFRGDVTSQLTDVHLAKAGLDFQRYNLEFGTPGQLIQATQGGTQQLVVRTDTLDARVNEYQPVKAAAYAQDRVEWKDLRIRAGLRLQYFDANTTVPGDLQNPANSIEGAPRSEPEETSPKWALAPRLGLSFPVLTRTALYFSYGHFYQMPELGQMFDNADYSVLEDLQAGTALYNRVFSNPNLEPEFTAQYEFGFKSELNEYLGLDLALFYKDIRNLLGVAFIETYTAAEYTRFTNVDFGQVSGLTLEFDQIGPGPIRTSLNYTYQQAFGNSSDPRETANRAAAGKDPRPRLIPFNWDQRHTLNATATVREENDYAVSLVGKLSSGQPYTPSIGTTFGADLPDNSGRKSTFVVVDLRAEKFFPLGGGLRGSGFLRVFNLFDQHFANGFVFPSTGSPFYSLVPASNRAQLTNPARFRSPRRFEVGITISGGMNR